MRLISTTLALAAVMTAAAGGNPLWLRNTALAPDGQTVAFTYQGDIYTVPISGGRATQLTSNAAYDTAPVWSPDGRTIVFSSKRSGMGDLYMMPSTGGNPVRLTTYSATETPLAFLNDSTVIFQGSMGPSAQSREGYVFPQLYTVALRKGARPHLLASMPSNALSVGKDGRILYEDRKGYEDRMRKHERSSVTGDLWLVEGLGTKDPQFSQLTTFNGHDLNPQWTGDDTFMYVSEEDGILNVWARNLDGTGKRQLTHFKDHPVRSLSVDHQGTAVFSWDGEIYVMQPGQEPHKLTVEIIKDGTDDDRRPVAGTGAGSICLSPKGKEVAFTKRGNVFVTSVDYGTTKTVTDTPEQERILSWAPDGRTLYYDSERDGRWRIYKAEIVNPEEKEFTYATEIRETPVVDDTAHLAMRPHVSPDGKKLAYLRDRTELVVHDLATGEEVVAVPGKYAYSYSDGDVDMDWNPNSDWLLFASYIGVGGWNNPDVAAVKADGSKIVNLTESGYSDGNAHWTPDGLGVVYESDKYGYRSHGSWGATSDAYVMYLDDEAYTKALRDKEERALAKAEKSEKSDKSDKSESSDKSKKSKKSKKGSVEPAKEGKYEFDRRKERRRRLTGNSSSLGDFYLSPEADKFYYVAAFEKGGDLWVRDLLDGSSRILAKDWGYGPLVPDSAGTRLYTIYNGQLKYISIPDGDVKSIEAEPRYTYSASKERDYMYDHTKALIQNKFHDVNLHGTDWEKYTEAYRKFLPYINNRTDYALMLSELLGELNASHTGGRAYEHGTFNSETDMVPTLGAFFDEEYTGDGLKVTEVIERGPLAVGKVKVQPGDIIEAIDGKPVKAGEDYYPLLMGKDDERTRLTVRHADGRTEQITVKPTLDLSELLYRRWVDRNQALVDSLSQGRVGYVHIKGMDSESFRTIYDEILGKYRNRDAVVVDTRYNGGGWLHNDVALLLNGKKYVEWVPRGQYIGDDPFSQWCKPSAMITNECNYSDAHGTPFVYQTLGIGPIVGAPVPGTMTAVWWETLIDPSLVIGVPQVTTRDMQGNVLENHQLQPDIEVYNAPAEVLRGQDRQIEAAVKYLLDKTAKK